MIYNRVNGQIEATMDDLELIVSVANMAGYLENSERIVVGDDTELTQFCFGLVEQYYREIGKAPDFFEYATEALLNKYKVDTQ